MAQVALNGMRDLGKSCAVKAVDVVYHASAASVLAFGVALLFTVGISLAVAGDLICVPLVHAR